MTADACEQTVSSTLYTERFRLRLLREDIAEHAALFRSLYTCPAVMAQIASPLSREVADSSFTRVCRHNTLDMPGHRFWAIEHRSSGNPVGLTALQRQGRTAEIGIMLLQEWWNQRVAGESFRVLLNHASAVLELAEVRASGRAGAHARILDRLLAPLGFVQAFSDPAAHEECQWVLDVSSMKRSGPALI